MHIRKDVDRMNRFDRDRFDAMGKEALSRVEELMNSSRINELLHKREEDEKKKNCILWVLAIIGAVAAVAGIAYAVYRFFTPDYLEDFEDDFDDDFDDDFFEDEEDRRLGDGPFFEGREAYGAFGGWFGSGVFLVGGWWVWKC